jgi:hypothetical protein
VVQLVARLDDGMPTRTIATKIAVQTLLQRRIFLNILSASRIPFRASASH